MSWKLANSTYQSLLFPFFVFENQLFNIYQHYTNFKVPSDFILREFVSI